MRSTSPAATSMPAAADRAFKLRPGRAAAAVVGFTMRATVAELGTALQLGNMPCGFPHRLVSRE